MLTTSLRQLTGGRYPVEGLCVEVLVCLGVLRPQKCVTLSISEADRVHCSRVRSYAVEELLYFRQV